MSREVVQNTNWLQPARDFDDPLLEALHEGAEVVLVARAMELEVATILNARGDGTVDAEATLLSLLHRLLPQRHGEA